MFLIRRARMEDVQTLLKLGRMVHFINLPPDKDIIADKVVHSRNCFIRAASGADRPEPVSVARNGTPTGLAAAARRVPLFMFVLEDTETGNCLGTSQVLARMGGPGNPNVSYKLEKRSFFSQSLQTGTSHIVAKMYLDESGPTEIGGLILQPSLRGHKQRLGRLLSLVRFHFIGLHRPMFADQVLAEMMAPITPDGVNLFWESLGRRFVPLSYDEADRFCQHSREFMFALLPRDDIYLSLLPPAARSVVGQVNPETVPARRMLEKLGFRYDDFVDPFDGGPHLHARTDEIAPARDTRWREFGGSARPSDLDREGIVSTMESDGEFRATSAKFGIAGDGRVVLEEELASGLRALAGAPIGVTPLDGSPLEDAPASRSKRTKPRESGPARRTRRKPAGGA
ncbi:MAG: arginine N-succinyltransferase [Phycisphaeraceae bacterium]|nr:arginine N-succinyltransferase [Phycisphaeraceae bacterium]